MREVDHKHAALWFEHAPDLAGALLAHLAREVVKHQRAHDHVKLRLRERQRLGNGGLEGHVDSCLRGLRGCPRDHGGGRVDADHLAGWPNLPLGNNCQRSSSAPDIEHRFAGCEVRQANQLFAERAIAPMCQEPYEQVVPGGPVQNAAKRGGWDVR